MSTGALGRGSYRSVVAGTHMNRLPTYYPGAFELIELHKAHNDVLRSFLVRDKVFDNKFPGCAIANGLFKMVPNKRENYHTREVMEGIRKRTIWIQRLKRQRAINAAILSRASKELSPEEMQQRFSYATPDTNAYFNPKSFTAANNYPNFWQHPTTSHVVPRPHWRRAPELGGITRVDEAALVPPMDY